MSHAEAKIDQLLASLELAGPLERKQIAAELGRLNRQKVLSPRPGWSRADWKQVPIIDYTQPGPPPDNLKEYVKLFLRLAAGGAAEVASTRGGELQFVGLFRFEVSDEGIVLSLTCPLEEPRRFMKEAWSGGASQALEHASRDLNLKCNLVEGTTVPIVFAFQETSDVILLTNQNHFSNPDQFIKPRLCDTTSGFLNFIGAITIKNSDQLILENTESLMNRGFDEWFRWLYCMLETGVIFSPHRLLVRRSYPEQWSYDYDG